MWSFASLPSATTLNIITVNSKTPQMDVYVPSGTGPFPLIVTIHGGGWAGGARSDILVELPFLFSKNYVIANIDYRLFSGSTDIYPAAVQDTRCAIRQLVANAATYKINTGRIVLLGYSAGAHLASLAGVASSANSSLDHGNCAYNATNYTIKSVVSLFGPNDLRYPSDYSASSVATLEGFLGTSPNTNPSLANQASPITYVNSASPSFLLLHGISDSIVPIEISYRMATVLYNTKVPLNYEPISAGHGFSIFSNSAGRAYSMCTSQAFIENAVK